MSGSYGDSRLEFSSMFASIALAARIDRTSWTARFARRTASHCPAFSIEIMGHESGERWLDAALTGFMHPDGKGVPAEELPPREAIEAAMRPRGNLWFLPFSPSRVTRDLDAA